MDEWQTLLLHLYKEGRAWTNRLDRSDWRKQIASIRCMLDEPQVRIVNDENEAINWVREGTKAGVRKGFVLAPGKYQPNALVVLVPFLSSDGGKPKLSLQIGIVLDENGKRSFFGYRFESPEGYDEHNFFHAQPIQSFGHGEKSAHAIRWYPDRYPTFPLKARTPFELVASMILACRDWRHMVELAASSSLGIKVKNPLRTFLQHVSGVAA